MSESLNKKQRTRTENKGSGGILEPRPAPGRIQKLANRMRQCLSDLGATATDVKLETWVCLIYESMSAPSRTFHSVQHVFDITVGADPLQTIAAGFHDVIYFSIDGGFSPAQGEVLKGIISEDDKGMVILNDFDPKSDELMALLVDIFGFSSGQVLNPFQGLNEFLSAALAVRCLEGTLGLPHLAQIATCIEATIPFRGPTNGKTAAEHLFERLKKANSTYDLGLTHDDIVMAIKRAVDLANRDVGNFSTKDHAHFLSNTWNLLPESNVNLRHSTVLRISDFTLALKKMAGFFANLDPAIIFSSFQGEPRKEILSDMTHRARENVHLSLKYVNCKLLSISVLAALAAETGGDAPIAMFMGDLPEQNYTSQSIEDFIPVSKEHDSVNLDESVYELLRDGRGRASAFDLKHSPLAAYLYGLIGDKGLHRSLNYAVYPMDEENAKNLLVSLPRAAVKKIALACAEISVTRAEKLRKIAEEYSK